VADWIQMHEDRMVGAFEEIGFVKMTREAFSSRYQISFHERDQSGMRGALSYALIQLRSGSQFFLQHEPRLAETGVWLYSKAGGDAQRQCREFAAAFSIDPDEILAF
jgi:hypothetical protein